MYELKEKEQKVFSQLYKLVNKYEHACQVMDQQKLIFSINTLSNRHISKIDLENYDCSLSKEDFCASLAIEIEPSTGHEQSVIESFVKTIMKNLHEPEKFEYYLKKYSCAIEYFYGKSTGCLSDYIYFEGVCTLDELLKRLESHVDGPILL